MSDMGKIYCGVVVPQMMYICLAWSNSRGNGAPYTRKTLQILQSLQTRGARAICGACRATSRAALDIGAHLFPVIQQIEKDNKHALGRIMSCQTIPELRDISMQGPSGNVYTSSLRNVYRLQEGKGSTNVYSTETIPPFIAPPWWLGPITHIEAETRARSTHDREIRKETMCMYTDGRAV